MTDVEILKATLENLRTNAILAQQEKVLLSPVFVQKCVEVALNKIKQRGQ